jgi:hypothetical protein
MNTMKTLATVSIGLIGFLAPVAAMAQQNFNGVRVMIAADDADPQSVIRSSDIYHRIQLPLNEEMKRFGYTSIFEDALLAETGGDRQDRLPKQKSIELAKWACTSNKATLCPRVLVLVKTRASARDLGFGTAAQVRMTGELIDANTNTYLGGWEAPTIEFPAPKACNNVCIEDTVGDNARKVALNLADTLRKMLDQQALRAPAPSSGAVTGRSAAAGNGLVNNFVVNFEHFQMQEVLPLKAIIETEFPETLDVTMPTGGTNSFSLNFATRAKADKVLEWLHLMMEDRGYNLSKIKITVSGDKFVVDRITDDGYRPAAPGRKFQ